MRWFYILLFAIVITVSVIIFNLGNILKIDNTIEENLEEGFDEGFNVQKIVNNKITFTEVSKEAGINYIQNNIDFSGLGMDSYLTSNLQALFSGDVTAGDYDNDGWMDLYVTKLDGRDILFRNLGNGKFEDVTKEVGLNLEIASNGAEFIDIDNDGWLDLFVTTINESRNYLFVNNKGKFSEEAIERGIGDENEIHYGFGIAIGDYDNDGYIDIHTNHWDRGSIKGLRNNQYGRLFRNLGKDNSEKGKFEDVTNDAGVRMITNQGFSDVSFSSEFVDLDNDGWLDLIVAADFGNSRLYWNEKGRFVDGTIEAGVGLDEFGMGLAVGDYDNDGLTDFFITSIYCNDNDCVGNMTGNKLYHNLGNGKFEEVAEELGVEDGGWGWATKFFDYDNDGDLDLVMAKGMREKIMGEHDFSGEAIKFWENKDGKFKDVTRELGLDILGDGRGLVIFDYDNDNDLDLFVVRNGDSPLLFRNGLN